MAQRGRKSAGSLAVVSALPGQRCAPPAELTEAQAEIWRAVVATKPADWFTEDSHPLLASFCRHVVSARMLSAAVDDAGSADLADGDELKRMERLLKMRDRETKAVNALARAMRLTQQSRYDHKSSHTAASAAAGRKPWEYGT